MISNRKDFLNLCFGIIGVIGLIFSIYTYERTKQNGLLVYHVVNRLVYKPITLDDLNVSVSVDKTIGSSPIFLSEITIWNAGNISFEQKDNRVPVRVLGDKAFNIIGHKIINSKSIVDSNYTTEIIDYNLRINWKIFDPGEALKLAIVHNGSPSSISIVGNFGPGRSIEQSGPVLLLQVTTFIVVVTALYLTIAYIWYPIMEKSENTKFAMNLTLKTTAFALLISIVGGVFWSTVYFGSVYFGQISPINKELEEYSGRVNDFSK